MLRYLPRWGALFAGSFWGLGLLALPQSVLAEELLKFVSSLPRTGSANAQTGGMVNGIRMAIEEAGGKVGDLRIAYEDWDDASPERGTWDPALEAANADRAIKDSDVLLYIGTFNSGAAKISMPKLNKAGLAMLSPANTWPGLTKPGVGEPNEPKVYRPSGKISYFRIVPTDDVQGLVAARWAREMGAKKVFLVHDGELYGKGIAQIFKRSAKDNSLEVLGFEQIDPKAANYKALAVRIKQLAPEVVYIGATTQTGAAQLVKDLVQTGAQSKIIVPDGCFENAFIEAAGKENAEGRVFVTFSGAPPSELKGKGAEFVEKYKAKYGLPPEGYAVYGYEAGLLAIDALRRAGKKDRAALIEALAQTRNFSGALGEWSFDENGDTSLVVMSGNSIKDGAFKFERLLSLQP